MAEALFRRRVMLGTLLTLLTGGFAAYLLMAPKQWEAEMTLLVKNNRADMMVSSNGVASTLKTEVTDADLATEVQLLQSYELAAKVVDQAMRGGGGDRASRERAIDKFQKELQVMPLMKSDMIRVRYSAITPDGSERALKILADAYMERNLRLHGNPESLTFFDQQTTDSDARLAGAQAKLLAFQKRSGVANAGTQKDLTLQKLLELRVALRQAEAECAETKQRIDVLRTKVAEMPTRIATASRQLPNQYSAERMNTMLTELRNRRTELLTKFPATDRMVVQLDQQITDTKAALDLAEKRISIEEATDVNPLYQTLDGELKRAQTTAAGLQGRITAMRAQDAQLQGELGRLETLVPAEQDLVRDQKVAEEKYLLYEKKREEARIGANLDQQKIANVIITDAPRASALPKARLTGTVIAAYLVGIALIGLLTALLGRMRRSANTPWELDGMAPVPVMGTVPTMPSLTSMHGVGHGVGRRAAS